MQSPQDSPNQQSFLDLYQRRWKLVILVAVSYLACMWLSDILLPHPATLFPASAIALSALFLEGLEFWPVIYVAALVGSILAGYPLLLLITMPIAQVLQAVAGAYLMRKAEIDPLFRRPRDIFTLIAIILGVSLIVPTFGSLTSVATGAMSAVSRALAAWTVRYVGTVFCLLILTPFLLRWFAKPRFNRTGIEILETFTVFAILIGIDCLLFVAGIGTVAGIPVVYSLLIPLFWIALRLRPRFVTLALVVTSFFAIASLYIEGTIATPALFSAHLFQTEEFLIVIAIIFLIIVSLEEGRRLTSNLLRSQVATLENAVAKIASESNAKNDFIAVLAHELRNPLAPIMSAIDFLRLKGNREQEELDTIVTMEDGMHTVRRLLDDLLDVSRISEGKLSLRKEQISLEVVIKRAVSSTAHHLKERHQSLVFKTSGEPVFVQVDAVRIEQVFSNLLTNASRYSHTGGQISIVMKKQQGEVEITISDKGIGIEPEVVDKIFTPFYQATLSSRGKKGLGIGLALVRSFVDMHDGSVVASSKGLGKGSQFIVRLPLVEEGSVDVPSNKQNTHAGFANVRKQTGPSVLIVDDNDAAAWGMGRLLELKGCTVDYAYDGRQAIEKAGSMSPDIILLDIGLPDQDGYGVAKILRALGFRGRLIALTGHSTDDAREKGKEAGFEHYLIKPAGLADLQRVIPEIA